MSSRSGDSPEHRSAIQQLATARERALDTIHVLRSSSPDLASTNLIEIGTNRREPHPSAEATACIADYLSHLKPHVVDTKGWQESIGLIEIPKKIEGSSHRRGHSGGYYYCTRMPYLNINNMEAAIRGANLEVPYAKSSGRATFDGAKNVENIYIIDNHALTEAGYQQHQNGTPISECEHKKEPPMADDGLIYANPISDFEPAPRAADEEKYQFVFTLSQLIELYDIADTLATNADLLADIKTPDATDQSGF
jgi:hypothetical protein